MKRITLVVTTLVVFVISLLIPGTSAVNAATEEYSQFVVSVEAPQYVQGYFQAKLHTLGFWDKLNLCSTEITKDTPQAIRITGKGQTVSEGDLRPQPGRLAALSGVSLGSPLALNGITFHGNVHGWALMNPRGFCVTLYSDDPNGGPIYPFTMDIVPERFFSTAGINVSQSLTDAWWQGKKYNTVVGRSANVICS